MSTIVDTVGISIQRFSYGETSQVVHFLTEDLGRVVAWVRGGHREKNAYDGPVDLLVRGRLRLSLHKEAGVCTLTRRRIEWAYPHLRRSWQHFRLATCMLGLVLDTAPVCEGAGTVFRLFDRALRAAETVRYDRLPILQLSFELHLLLAHGLQPNWNQCVRCGSKRGPFRFLAAEGGVICRSCRGATWEGIPISDAARRFLDDLSEQRVVDLAAPPDTVLRSAAALVENHLRYHLERPAMEHRDPSPTRRVHRG